MYIKKVSIVNIRSIEKFEMEFDQPAGWHVIIGDNGSGKSTILRSIALSLLGEDDAKALSFSEEFANWLPPGKNKGTIKAEALRDNNYDMPANKSNKNLTSEITIERLSGNDKVTINGKISHQNALWGQYSSNNGWFVAAYGPFRRLKGNYETVVSSRPRLGACITAFKEEVALTQLPVWLKNLALDSDKKPVAKKTIDYIINFINHSDLLPGGAQLTNDIDSEGIRLKDGNNVNISLQEMSDGFRSVLSMLLDIIRYMIEVYGLDKIFMNSGNQNSIDLPGVVLIDEIDAHLHPTWQTRIGGWFLKYFPNIQFIVSTHSPLICRACDHGSIMRLAAPGSGKKSSLIEGIDKDKLVFGNILDAYGTEIFGDTPVKSSKTDEKLKRLGQLNRLSALGKISPEGEIERTLLQFTLSTNVTA